MSWMDVWGKPSSSVGGGGGSLWVGVLFVVVWEEVIFLDEGVEGGSFVDIVDIVVVCLGSEGVLLVVCVGYGLRWLALCCSCHSFFGFFYNR